MTITNGYTTLAELKSSIVANATSTDSARDALIESTIEAISRMIDNHCGREFFQSTTTRYFSSCATQFVLVDDISTATGLVIYTGLQNNGTYSETWASTDYNLVPYSPTLGFPYTALEVANNGSYSFSTLPRGNKITATWGWSAIPKPIATACLLQSHRTYARYKTPLGSSAMTSLGEIKLSIPQLDPDVMALLSPYRRLL